jgi:hypothetical protein
MFAAFEVAGAELAATLTAEAAAAAAAEAAAVEAARVAAAETVAQQATQEAARQAAAQTAVNSGITGVPDPSQLAAKGSFNPSTGQFVNTTLPITPPSAPYPPLEVGNNPFNKPFPEYSNFQAAPPTAPPSPFTPNTPPMGMEGQIPANQFIEAGSGGINSTANTIAQANAGAPLSPPSALESGFDKALRFADKHPFPAMALAYTGANALGLMNPSAATFNQEKYDGPLSRYQLSPNFRGSTSNPADFRYTPRYATGGGIMGSGSYDIPVGYNEGGDMPEYAKGGSLSDSIESYQKMLEGKPQAAPSRPADVGIYYDQDPDTRYQDALTAAQIRQAKVNQRAYVSPPVAKRPTPMGQLQMASIKPRKQSDSGGGDVEAAQGGIMQSSLGGYAAGGNPRLLKGPGDGMSDNIPATINGRQPARLADGEFVIPADVVSHLGNGSTEAGAKQLHAMMNKVRRARTGNSKQGKNIKPQKYMPK